METLLAVSRCRCHSQLDGSVTLSEILSVCKTGPGWERKQGLHFHNCIVNAIHLRPLDPM